METHLLRSRPSWGGMAGSDSAGEVEVAEEQMHVSRCHRFFIHLLHLTGKENKEERDVVAQCNSAYSCRKS